MSARNAADEETLFVLGTSVRDRHGKPVPVDHSEPCGRSTLAGMQSAVSAAPMRRTPLVTYKAADGSAVSALIHTGTLGPM